MGAWEKFQLGWLNYEVAFAGERSSHRSVRRRTNTKQAQALFTVLPDKLVTEVIGAPYAGDNFYYSGQGNDLDNVMYRQFDLAAGSTMTAQVNVRHRGRLGLRVRRGLDRRWCIVDPDRDQRVDDVETQRPELRLRHHR